VNTLVEQIHDELGDLMGEIGMKNHVRVVVHRGVEKGKQWAWSPGELVHDNQVDGGGAFALLPSLLQMDQLRLLAGRKAMWLPEAMRRTGGELVSVTPNLRVNVGIDYCAVQLGGSASATVAKNLALSSNTDSPVATDTSSNTTAGTGINWGTNTTTDAAASNARGEINYAGLGRAAAAYAHTTSATSFSQSKTFTATGAVTAVQACGLFDSATNQAGTLFVENTFTPTTLANTDQLTIAWTLNI
jgi:hypothetical protein